MTFDYAGAIRRALEPLEIKLIIGAVVFSIVLYLSGDLTPITTPDSRGYLEFWSIRTGGYPAFIWVVISLFGSVDAIVFVQIILLHVSVLGLGLVLYDFAGRPWIALIAVILMLAPPWMVEFSKGIVTEGLFIPLTIAWCALVMIYLKTRGGGAIAWLLIVAALAIVVRPAGLVFLPFSVLLLVSWPPASWRKAALASAAGLAVALAVFAVEWKAYQDRYGPARESLLGIVWLARSALITIPQDGRVALSKELSPGDLALSDRIDDDFRAVRAFIGETDQFALREHLVTGYEGFAMFEYQRMIGIQPATETMTKVTFNTATSQRIALARIKTAPFAFITLIAVNYVALWSPFSIRTPAMNSAYRALVEKNGLPFIRADATLLMVPDAHSIYFVPRIAFQVFGIATAMIAAAFLAAIMFFRKLSAPAFALGFSATLLHVYALLCATTAFGILRYMTTMSPLIILICVFAVLAANTQTVIISTSDSQRR